MNEAMKTAWLEISGMLGEPTREELDVFLRTWQRATEAHKQALAEQPAQQDSSRYQELREVLENLMSWQVKNVDKWHNGAYDQASRVLKRHNATPQPAQQEYERGFIDGMQEQMRRSVDRAVNAMAQRTWVGLTDEQIDRLWSQSLADTESETWLPLREFARAIEAKIKEKNQ